ncbi:MAG TPA: NADH-quinone oxidoreductase subunit J [Candidatus Saccharimonadales bacterium]|nr:NADH-quinone oxidoreductase subunit J [Candidatus Saccharimonadales bacterium]
MITPQIAIFLVLAAFTVAGAVSLILQRHPIHSALSLIVVMVSLAGLYLLQGAEFVAAVQVIVYAGAIMVVFIFVIMLLNAGEEERTNVSRLAKFVGVPLGIVFLAEVAFWIGRATSHLGSAPQEAVSTHDLSTLLFREYVFPFELTSFLILIALLGALVLARRESSD